MTECPLPAGKSIIALSFVDFEHVCAKLWSFLSRVSKVLLAVLYSLLLLLFPVRETRLILAMSLQGCVASLTSSCNILSSSLATLDSGIADFPRLIKVLQNTRHFELLPESDVLAAQAELRGEIGPQREELLRRAEKALQALARREYSLKSKWELQDVRLRQKPNKARNVTVSTTDEGQQSAAERGTGIEH